jgi:hypothetical protein
MSKSQWRLDYYERSSIGAFDGALEMEEQLAIKGSDAAKSGAAEKELYKIASRGTAKRFGRAKYRCVDLATFLHLSLRQSNPWGRPADTFG